jgi:hypothetical protein
MRLQETSLLADVELREGRLARRERDVTEREELMGFRERELAAHLGGLTQRAGDRNVA